MKRIVAVDLRDIRYFSVLAQELHFGRAAQRIGISTPGLSAAIRRLEDESGVALFERLPRGARLTRAGSLLVEGAQQMLQAHADMLASIRRQVRGEASMRIAGPVWLHDEWMAPVLAQLARREPTARYVLHGRCGREAESALVAGELDAAVMVGAPTGEPVRGRALECVPIGDDPALPIVRIGHPRLRSAQVSVSAVCREEWVAAVADPIEPLLDAGVAAAIGEQRRIGARVADVSAMIDAVSGSDRVGWCQLSVLQFVRDRVEPLPGLGGLTVRRPLLLARRAGDDLPGWSELTSMLSLRHRMLVAPLLRDGSRFLTGSLAAAGQPPWQSPHSRPTLRAPMVPLAASPA